MNETKDTQTLIKGEIEFSGAKEDKDMSNLNESEFSNNETICDEPCENDSIDTNGKMMEKLTSEISKRTEYEGSIWKCTECGKVCKRKDRLRLHIETHHKSIEQLDKGVAMDETKDKQTLIKSEIETFGAQEELLNSKKHQDVDRSNLNESEFLNNETSFDEPCENDLIATNGEMMEKLVSEILKRTDSEGSMWKCTECGKLCKRKDRLGLHIETHLEGFSHPCKYCNIPYKTRGSLQVHISTTHRGQKPSSD